MLVYLFMNKKQNKKLHMPSVQKGASAISAHTDNKSQNWVNLWTYIHSPHSPPKFEHIFKFSIVYFNLRVQNIKF